MSANLDSIGEACDFENVSNPSQGDPDPPSESMMNSSPEVRSLQSASLSSIKFNHTLNSDVDPNRSSQSPGGGDGNPNRLSQSPGGGDGNGSAEIP